MVNAEPVLETPNDDWPARASATVVQYVGTVREKTTGPALTASRNVVYITAMALIGLTVAVLGLVLLVRILVVATSYLPSVDEGEAWAAYFILGALFLIAGAVLWRMKEPR